MQVKIEYTWQQTAVDLFQRVKPAMESEITRMQQTIENDPWHDRKDVFLTTINTYQALMQSLDFGFLHSRQEVNQRICLISHFGWPLPFSEELIGTGALLASLLCNIEKPEFVQQQKGSEKTICFPDHVLIAEHSAKEILKTCGFDEHFAIWVSLLIRNSYQPYHAFSPSPDRSERIRQFIACDFDKKFTAWVSSIVRPPKEHVVNKKQAEAKRQAAIELQDTIKQPLVNAKQITLQQQAETERQSIIKQQYKTMFCLSLMALGIGQMAGSDLSRLDPPNYTGMFNAYKETFLKFSFSEES